MVDRAGSCRNSTVPTANHGAVVTTSYHSWQATEEDVMRLLADGHAVASSFKIESGYHLYRNRVYQHKNCQNWRTHNGGERLKDRDHAITIVGYGTQDGIPYWKFKNSWGSGFGDNGFMKILRGVGHCGMAMEFSVPYCTAATGPAPKPTPAPTPAPNNEGTCGGTLTAKKGVIINEGYPAQYKTDQTCIWDIKDASNSANMVVKFTVKDMDVEYTGTCKYDHVQFLNSDNSLISLGDGRAANQGKLCGEIIPAPFFSKTNGAYVIFHSDGKRQKKGFKIEYEIVESESCSNVQLNTAIGVQPVTFSSPHYPGHYDNWESCAWTIAVPAGQRVNLVFSNFVTANGDWVKVLDGENRWSKELAWLSGYHSGGNLQYTSTGNKMHVVFKANEFRTKMGFKATAEAV